MKHLKTNIRQEIEFIEGLINDVMELQSQMKQGRLGSAYGKGLLKRVSDDFVDLGLCDGMLFMDAVGLALALGELLIELDGMLVDLRRELACLDEDERLDYHRASITWTDYDDDRGVDLGSDEGYGFGRGFSYDDGM